jgi:transposase-like protein
LLSRTTSLVRSWLHRAGVEKRLSLVAIARRPMVRRRGSITASMLRAWWNRDDGGHARSPRRSNTQAAISHAGADLAAENARLRRENERLRMEREIQKKIAAHFLGSAETKLRLIADQREMFPVRVMCDVMGVSSAEYYAWRGRPESSRKAANHALLTEIRRVHTAHRGRYGAPRIHAALRAGGCRRAVLSNPGCRPARLVRLRRILQSFRPRIYHPRTGRAPSRLIQGPLNRGKVRSRLPLSPWTASEDLFCNAVECNRAIN